MIKVPATPGGLAALEELVAAGVTLNVTLIFSERQYKIARDAVLARRPAAQSTSENVKTVYSIFVSRVDVYTEKHVPDLSPAAQGQVGIVNAKRIWKLNQDFWADKKLPLQAGDDLRQHRHEEAGGPAVEVRRGVRRQRHRDQPAGDQRRRSQKSGRTFTRQVDQMPPAGGAGRDRREGGHRRSWKRR